MAEMKAIILKYGIVLGLLILTTSCLEKRDVLDVSTHPSNWMVKTSEQFHGLAVTSSTKKLENCQTCHGDNFSGGTSKVSCYDAACHISYPHPEYFSDPNAATSHVSFIRDEINWDITTCKGCHGIDYAGAGSYNKNCLKCHQKEDGPEDCSVCHGSNDNAAPPEDLAENSGTYHVTVGAHQAHVSGTKLTTNMLGNCTTCHSDVPAFDVASHINDGTSNSEVIFSNIGNDFTTNSPNWDRNSATCSNVYCHGAFTFPEHDNNFAYEDSAMLGTYQTMTWNSVGSYQAICGSCHGLPPEGHIASALNECANCHPNVVDSNLNIVGKSLHINGRVDH